MPGKKRKLTPEPVQAEFEYLKKHVDKLWEQVQDASERLQDIEVHVNLLTRLLTALCVEKLGMRIGVLKRMIRKIEKEAIRDTQVHQLESLYKLPPPSPKKHHPPKSNFGNSWEDIS